MIPESFFPLVENGSFHSEIYKSDRFVHRSIVFVIYEKLQENSYMTNLVTRILSRGTRKFLRSYQLSRFLYSLYGTYLDGSVTKWGSNLVYTLTIKNLVPENWEDPMQLSVDLALEMILKATWENQMFFEAYFKEEKSNQITEIKDLINEKFRYAFEQFIHWMFENEPFGISVLGDEKSIKKISNNELSSFYKDHFLHQKRMIFFLDKKVCPIYEDLIAKFSHYSPVDAPSNHETQNIKYKFNQVRRRTEKDKNQQSWIFMGYRFKDDFSEDMYPAMLLFNNILGGQSNSILYRKVREEKGLCYFVSSSLPAGVDAIIISAGISKKNKKTFEKVIQEEISELTNHTVDHQLLKNTKELTLTALFSVLDHPYQLISMQIESILFKRMTSLQGLMDRINGVSVEQIQKVAQELYLDCVYVLQGTE